MSKTLINLGYQVQGTLSSSSLSGGTMDGNLGVSGSVNAVNYLLNGEPFSGGAAGDTGATGAPGATGATGADGSLNAVAKAGDTMTGQLRLDDGVFGLTGSNNRLSIYHASPKAIVIASDDATSDRGDMCLFSIGGLTGGYAGVNQGTIYFNTYNNASGANIFNVRDGGAARMKVDTTTASTAGNISFATAANAGAGTTYSGTPLVIGGNGKVGVGNGVDISTYGLNVNGSLNASSLYVGGSRVTATPTQINAVGTFVTREEMSGGASGIPAACDLDHPIISGSEMIFLNGQLLNTDGATGQDYSVDLTGGIGGVTRITLLINPGSSPRVLASYRY